MTEWVGEGKLRGDTGRREETRRELERDREDRESDMKTHRPFNGGVVTLVSRAGALAFAAANAIASTMT